MVNISVEKKQTEGGVFETGRIRFARRTSSAVGSWLERWSKFLVFSQKRTRSSNAVWAGRIHFSREFDRIGAAEHGIVSAVGGTVVLFSSRRKNRNAYDVPLRHVFRARQMKREKGFTSRAREERNGGGMPGKVRGFRPVHPRTGVDDYCCNVRSIVTHMFVWHTSSGRRHVSPSGPDKVHDPDK